MFNNYDQLLYIYIILLDYHVVFPISDGVWAKLGMVIWQLRSGDSGLGDTSGCGLVVKENVGTCS